MKIGCFGLTEPDHGSNPSGMVTTFKDMGDHYLLNGAKMWISNAPFARIAVVWAKADEHGGSHPRPHCGARNGRLHHPDHARQMSLRASPPVNWFSIT
jgi:alkylation response protein AidB-like acyl-CoA dehydrogenase